MQCTIFQCIGLFSLMLLFGACNSDTKVEHLDTWNEEADGGGASSDLQSIEETYDSEDFPVQLVEGDCHLVETDLPNLEVERIGRYEIIRDFPSSTLLPRNIIVYLPEDYEENKKHYYPVLYMHDGQNLFDAQSAAFGVEWQVDESIDALVHAQIIEPHIVVGIENTSDRLDEYTLDVDPNEGGGKGSEYIELVVHLIKPYIDTHYRTRCGPENNTVMGSSLGGLISLDFMLRASDTFGRFGAISPSLWWNQNSILQRLESASELHWTRLWIDAGSDEGGPRDWGMNTMAFDTRQAYEIFVQKGKVLGQDFNYFEDIWASHNEEAWARRLPTILAFLLSDQTIWEKNLTDQWIYAYQNVLAPGQSSAVALNMQYDGIYWTTDWENRNAMLITDPNVLQWDEHGNIKALQEGVSFLILNDEALPRAEAVLVDANEDPNRVRVLLFASTPELAEDQQLYVSGNLEVLGAWSEPGIPMEHVIGNYWALTFFVPRQTQLEYKYTLGSWDSVERDEQGNDIPNRQINVESPLISRDQIAWF